MKWWQSKSMLRVECSLYCRTIYIAIDFALFPQGEHVTCLSAHCVTKYLHESKQHWYKSYTFIKMLICTVKVKGA